MYKQSLNNQIYENKLNTITTVDSILNIRSELTEQGQSHSVREILYKFQRGELVAGTSSARRYSTDVLNNENELLESPDVATDFDNDFDRLDYIKDNSQIFDKLNDASKVNKNDETNTETPTTEA